MGRQFVSLLLELAAAGVMMYTSTNPDMNIAAGLWLLIWKSAQSVAQAAGRLGMRAEIRYYETVKL